MSATASRLPEHWHSLLRSTRRSLATLFKPSPAATAMLSTPKSQRQARQDRDSEGKANTRRSTSISCKRQLPDRMSRLVPHQATRHRRRATSEIKILRQLPDNAPTTCPRAVRITIATAFSCSRQKQIKNSRTRVEPDDGANRILVRARLATILSQGDQRRADSVEPGIVPPLRSIQAHSHWLRSVTRCEPSYQDKCATNVSSHRIRIWTGVQASAFSLGDLNPDGIRRSRCRRCPQGNRLAKI